MKNVISSFVGGEVSPDLQSRVDLAKYPTFLKTCRNCVVTPYGGVMNRPGSMFITPAKYDDKAVKFCDFRFSVFQSYNLEFGDHYIRFFMQKAAIMTPTPSAWSSATSYVLNDYVLHGGKKYRMLLTSHIAPTPEPGVGAEWETHWENDEQYTIWSPYSDTDLAEMTFTQSIDVLYICCGTLPQMKLTRSGHADWSLEEVAMNPCPLLDENIDDTISITVTGTGVKETSHVLTASKSIFKSTHVGTYFGIRYIHGDASYTYETGIFAFTTDSWLVEGAWTLNIVTGYNLMDESDVYLEKSYDGGTTWTKVKTFKKRKSPVDITVIGNEKEPVHYRMKRDRAVEDDVNITMDVQGTERWAYFKITSVSSGTSASGTVLNTFDKLGTAFTSWAEGAWSLERGYPRCTSIFQNRLFFGSSVYQPLRFWGSVVGDYYNYMEHMPIQSDDAIKYDVASVEVNRINNMVSLTDMIAMTSNAEWRVCQGSKTDGLAPDSIKVLPQTRFGSSTVEPIVAGNTIIYVQELGSKVRDLSYTFESDSYNGKDLSLLSKHLLKGDSIVDWAYQQEPDSNVWSIMREGGMLGMTYMKEHDIVAWHRHDTDGTYEAISSIPDPDSGVFDVYIAVKRTINGVDKMYVECFSVRNDTAPLEYNFMDCYIDITNIVPTAVITGLDHLEGKTVVVLADGEFVGRYVVLSGTITISKTCAVARVGLSFTSEFENMGMEVQSAAGTLQNTTKRIGKVGILFLESSQVYAGIDTNRCYPVKMGVDGLKTGFITHTMPSGWTEGGSVYVKQEDPLPFKVLAFVPDVAIGG